MIEKCPNLSNLAHFDTQEKHICSVCAKVTKGQEEINLDIRSCQINIDSNFQNENKADMLKRTQPFDKFCSQCKTMNVERTGVSHNVIDCYTRPRST